VSIAGLNSARRPARRVAGARGAAAIAALAMVAHGCGPRVQSGANAKRGSPSLAYSLERAAALKDGIPVTPEALQGAMPPPDENAAPIYSRVAAAIEAKPLPPEIGGLSAPRLPASAQLTAARPALAARADLLALIRQAALRRKCVFAADWSNPNAIELIKPETARSIARLLRAQSLVLVSQHRSTDAVEWQALGFHVAAHLADQNWGFTDSYFVESSAMTGLDEILLLAGDDPRAADAVRATIEQQWRPASLAAAIRRRIGVTLVILDNVRDAGPDSIKPLLKAVKGPPQAMDGKRWNAFVDENATLLLGRAKRVIPLADRPYRECSGAISAMEEEVDSDANPNHLLQALMDEKYGYMLDQRASSIARAAVTRSAAAVLAYRGRHGAFPSELGEALQPPRDPFSGAPVGYRREGVGFVVYCPGKTGRFRGGDRNAPPARREAVFRYPIPPALAPARAR